MKGGSGLLFFAPVADEPGVQVCGLWRIGLKREDIGVGQEKAFSVQIIGLIGRLLIEGDQGKLVFGRMRRNHAGIKAFHSAAFAPARAVMTRLATHS